MNRDTTSRILLLSQLLVVCFTGSSIARAQQSSSGVGTGTYSSVTPVSSSSGESHSPGVYSSDSSVLTGESLLGQARRMGLANTSSASAKSASEKLTGSNVGRSAWLAGSSSMKGAGSTAWKAGLFGAHSGGASWIAGGNNFGLARQQDGIWRAATSAGLESLSADQMAGASSTSPFASSAPRRPTSLTAKGAGLVKSGSLSSRFPTQRGRSGSSGSGAGVFGSRSTSGGKQNPFASHSGHFGGSGAWGGSSAPQSGTPSETRTGPSLNSPLQRNGELESPDTLGLGTDKGTTDSSY